MKTIILSLSFIFVSIISDTGLAESGKVYLMEKHDIKANYQLNTHRVLPEQIGLKYNQTWVVNFSEISYQQIAKAKNYDEYLLKSAIQGLINRHGPMIYMDKGGFWGRTEKDQWQTYYNKTQKLQFLPLKGGLDALLEKTSKVFNGIILYDINANVDNYALAANLANINFALPVSKRLYEKHKASFKDLPVIVTLDRKDVSCTDTYTWLIENIMPQCDRTLVYSTAISLGDMVLGKSSEYVTAFDYAFYRKCFIFNISPSPYDIPQPAYNLTVSGSQEMARMFDIIMSSLIKPAEVFGWMEPEWYFIQRLSEFGHFQNCSASGFNPSFHGSVRPLSPPPYLQDTSFKIDKPKKKCYIAFISNEGGAYKTHENFLNGAWLSPHRGEFPVNWAMNPSDVINFPAMVEYFYHTKTNNDYFVTSGGMGGYFAPPYNPYIDTYLDFAAYNLAMMNIREIDIWYPSWKIMQAYINKIPQLRGFSMTPDGKASCGETFFVGRDKKLPVIRHDDQFFYWMLPDRGLTKDQTWHNMDLDKIAGKLNEFYENSSKPCFKTIYGVVGGVMPHMSNLVKRMDKDKFQFVDYATFFHLMSQTDLPKVKPGKLRKSDFTWNPKLLRQKSPWNQPLNDAIVTPGRNGLRIEISSKKDKIPGKDADKLFFANEIEGNKIKEIEDAGQDKTWGLVTISNVKIPANAKYIFVDVSELGNSGKWVLKLLGDFNGFDNSDMVMPFGWGGIERTGKSKVSLDRRLQDNPSSVLYQIQIGLEGKPGSYVVFKNINFLTE